MTLAPSRASLAMVGKTRVMRVGVGDGAAFDRHVEIDADKHPLALDVDPVDGPDAGQVETARGTLAKGAGR